MNTQAILLKYTKYSIVLFAIPNMLFLILLFDAMYNSFDEFTPIESFFNNYLYNYLYLFNNLTGFFRYSSYHGTSFFYVIGLVIHADMYRLFMKTLTAKLLLKHFLILLFLESFFSMMNLRMSFGYPSIESYYYMGIVFSCVYGFILLKCLYRFFKKDKSFAQKPTVKMRFLDMLVYIIEILVISMYFIIYSIKGVSLIMYSAL